MDLSCDKHPQYRCIFGGKSAHKEPELIDAEEWIGKKGYSAKGKKCHDRETVKKVEFAEPLVKEEPEESEPVDLEPVEIVLPDEDLSLPVGEIVLEEPTLF